MMHGSLERMKNTGLEKSKKAFLMHMGTQAVESLDQRMDPVRKLKISSLEMRTAHCETTCELN